MKSLLKLGTRKSLLAWAQSSWVAREVERLNPGIQVELIGIETRGDRILDVSLQSVAGKEFFVAEIDQALSAGEVDFTVHSMKDLSLERASQLTSAAIPRRENPRDVVLFGPHVMENIKAGRKLKIGTSSPRRIENIPSFLEKALPQVAPSSSRRAQLEFVEIRGNVNTRLSRVHEPLESAKYLDAVVLAFAGIIRLWADPAGQVELKKLLQGVRWMVLPLKECPAAPAQGALAIECRANDAAVIEALSHLHHPETAQRVASERQLLSDWGGGCHQRFGATALRSSELGDLLFVRGVKPDGKRVDEIRWKAPQSSSEQEVKPWDGSHWRSKEVTRPREVSALDGKAVFVAHSRAVEGALGHVFENTRVWTSGTASWFKLADQGIWVEGSAEGFGFETLIPQLDERVLQLPKLTSWIVLTHEDAVQDWNSRGIQVIPTYKINFDYGEIAKSALRTATHVFWSSGSQYDELKENVSPGAEHACGPGKTAARLKADGLKPRVFLSAEEWRRCLKIRP